MEHSTFFDIAHSLIGRITIDYPADISNSDPNHVKPMRKYPGLEDKERVSYNILTFLLTTSQESDDNRNFLFRCLQREEALTQQDGDDGRTSCGHKRERDGRDIRSGTSPIQRPPTRPKLHTRELPGNLPPSKGDGHSKFKRNAYVVPVKMYNPATAIASTHPISRQNQVQPSVSQGTTSAGQEKIADQLMVPPISGVEKHCHPTVPPSSQGSLDSSGSDGENKNPLGYPSESLDLDPKFFCQEVKTQFSNDVKAGSHPARFSSFTEALVKQDQILVSPSLVKNLRDTDSVYNSLASARDQDEQIKDREQHDVSDRTGAKITLQQILNDLSLQANKRNNEITDELKGHINEDDSASFNTRNEWWSVSSFHSRTAYFEDGNRSADEDLPPPPDGFIDFELPFDSLSKPIKKSTYHPIIQDGVLQFLESANWQSHPIDEDSGPVWTDENTPRQRIDIGIASSSESQQAERTRDRFLESIEVMRSNEQETLHLVANGARRNITETNPLSGAFRAGSLARTTPSYTEEHIFTRRLVINTQATPEWYPRHRHHQSLTVHSPDLNAEEATQQVDMSSSALLPKDTHKVHPDCYNTEIGMSSLP
jgi:hypothetical protein